jgi:hypothetical protein
MYALGSVLGELGFGPGDLAELRAAGVIDGR